MLPIPIEMSPTVINAINGELQYQSTLTVRGRADSTDYGVEGQLITLAVYTRRAQEAWTDNAGSGQALDVLRKVAAIAIRALEQYGCPQRKGF